MSVKVMQLIWERAPYVEHGLILVLLALADWANDEGFCWPSMDLLAEKSRQSRRNISYVLKRLEDDEVIDLQRGNGRGHSTHYRINIERLQRMQPLHPLMGGETVRPKPSFSRKVKVAKDEVVASFIETKDEVVASFPHDLKVAKDATSDISPIKDARAEPSVKESLKDTTGEPAPSLPEKPQRRPKVLREQPKHDPEGFKRFYAPYPKHTHLQDTIKAWDMQRPTADLRELIIANVEARAHEDPEWLKDSGKYAPNPAAYLNNGRWTDEWKPARRVTKFVE